MSYTPTVWADGDLITAEKMNKLEQGVKNEQVGPPGPPGPAGPAGKTGPTGPKGDPGKTPQKGVDYWTHADQAKLDEAAAAKKTADEAFSLAQTNEEDIRVNELDITALQGVKSRLLDLSGHAEASMQASIAAPWTVTLTSAEYAILDDHAKTPNYLGIKDKDGVVFACTETRKVNADIVLLVNSFVPEQSVQAIGVMTYTPASHALKCQGYAFKLTPSV